MLTPCPDPRETSGNGQVDKVEVEIDINIASPTTAKPTEMYLAWKDLRGNSKDKPKFTLFELRSL